MGFKDEAVMIHDGIYKCNVGDKGEKRAWFLLVKYTIKKTKRKGWSRRK